MNALFSKKRAAHAEQLAAAQHPAWAYDADGGVYERAEMMSDDDDELDATSFDREDWPTVESSYDDHMHPASYPAGHAHPTQHLRYHPHTMAAAHRGGDVREERDVRRERDVRGGAIGGGEVFATEPYTAAEGFFAAEHPSESSGERMADSYDGAAESSGSLSTCDTWQADGGGSTGHAPAPRPRGTQPEPTTVSRALFAAPPAADKAAAERRSPEEVGVDDGAGGGAPVSAAEARRRQRRQRFQAAAM